MRMTYDQYIDLGERPPARLTAAESATIATARDILQKHVRKADLIASWAMLIDYLALNAITERTEVFRCLFLDTRNRLIRDKVMSRGTIDHVPVYVREVIRSAVLLDANAMILCHNHPSGDPTPSRTDILMTEKLIAATRALEITIHDHVIVGHGSERHSFSMRAAGTVEF